jgi:hypothetical protein
LLKPQIQNIMGGGKHSASLLLNGQDFYVHIN